MIRIIDAVIGEYHDFLFINGNEIILNPTEQDYERVAKEGGIDLRTVKIDSVL
jgi:hypothetical protein